MGWGSQGACGWLWAGTWPPRDLQSQPTRFEELILSLSHPKVPGQRISICRAIEFLPQTAFPMCFLCSTPECCARRPSTPARQQGFGPVLESEQHRWAGGGFGPAYSRIYFSLAACVVLIINSPQVSKAASSRLQVLQPSHSHPPHPTYPLQLLVPGPETFPLAGDDGEE